MYIGTAITAIMRKIDILQKFNVLQVIYNYILFMFFLQKVTINEKLGLYSSEFVPSVISIL